MLAFRITDQLIVKPSKCIEISKAIHMEIIAGGKIMPASAPDFHKMRKWTAMLLASHKTKFLWVFPFVEFALRVLNFKQFLPSSKFPFLSLFFLAKMFLLKSREILKKILLHHDAILLNVWNYELYIREASLYVFVFYHEILFVLEEFGDN